MTSYVNSAIDGGNLLSLAPAWPTVQAGDVALLWWLMQNTSTPTASGFTLPAGGLQDGTSGSMRMGLYWRALDGSESGTAALTGTATNRQCAGMAIYRGAHPTAPLSDFAFLNEASAVSSHACPAVTPQHAGCAIVTAVGERASTGTSGWTAPTGYTERADTDGLASGTGGTVLAIADDGLATSRTVGVGVTPPNWVSTNSFATANVLTWSVALRPLDPAVRPRLVAARAAVVRAARW